MHSVAQNEPEHIHDDSEPWPAMAEADHAARTPDRQRFRQVLAELAEKATVKLPESAGRIAKAVALILAGDVEGQSEDGSWRVGSCTEPRVTHRVQGTSCSCDDSQYGRAPRGLCKHALSVMLTIRVAQVLASEAPQAARAAEPEPEPETPAAAVHEAVQGIDPKWVQMIHGKPHVRYQGLLALAHERGLVSLKARFVGTPTLELAVAEAEAVFADGRIFCECGDATPANIQAAHIRPHLLRMALTRAKSRALRDALNVGEAAVEELE
jgi:hypothetical protein